MLPYLQIAATLICLTICASPIAFPQNTAAEDAKSLVRNWGPEVNGLALSIGVDKTTYVVGEAIPLHVAVRNISASKAMTLPCNWAEVITVRNAKGEKLDSIDGDLSCNTSNPCEPVVDPGDVVASERNLTDYRLPPATYTVTGEWITVAYLGPPKSWDCFGPHGTQKFHVYSNPVTILIKAAN